jgi:hypothetical protein
MAGLAAPATVGAERRERAVGLQIVCVERKGKKPAHRHVIAVGVDTPQVVIRFSVKTVRKILKRRTMEFYCLGPGGQQVTVRRYRCSCGVKTIRTQPDDIADGVLSALPTCSSRMARAAGPILAVGLVPRPDPRSAGGPPEPIGSAGPGPGGPTE